MMTEPQDETTPSQEDFIQLYLKYTAQTECPTFFHRWVAVTCLSAYLGRNCYFEFGHDVFYPNFYTMLIGAPGTKKSTAIKIGVKLLKKAGYKTFAAKKTRQEKFLLDLADQSEKRAVRDAGSEGGDVSFDVLDQNLFGEAVDEDSVEAYEGRPPTECLIAADEFNNFIGIGNMDFVSILGDLWDYDDVYDYKLKNSKSVFIPYPAITILGGNTPTGFAQAFPTESIGQGFFSRLLLIYGEPSGVKFTIPPKPDLEVQKALVDLLHKIKREVVGKVTLTAEGYNMLDKIYRNDKGIDDIRFEHYAGRKLTHLIKLALVLAASKLRTVLDKQDIIEANTLLTFTEHLMPKALGEFGKNRSSDIAQKIMTMLNTTKIPLTFKDMWKAVLQDVSGRNELMEILSGLQVADKIQCVAGQAGQAWLPIKKVRDDGVEGAVDWNLLTIEEREMI